MTQPMQGTRQAGLTVAALGVVYGDIGTSPLYALRECFHGPHAIAASTQNILGVLSLILWSLILIVSVKYLTFILRADNKGEGGILALLPLAVPDWKNPEGVHAKIWLIGLGVFGAALLYGDGMITPVISILGAMEGLKVFAPRLESYIVPLTAVIIIGLFWVQRFGTGRVGKTFGPIMLLWFSAIGLWGLMEIVRVPAVLAAVFPWHALGFFAHNQWQGFVVLGSVFLCVTGAEALYADMGHFGRSPIRRAWFLIAMPGLLFNYFGQGALLMTRPEAAENPFYRLAPGWALVPMLILATMAAIIASQAVISGAFSLTMQAMQLGYSPRLEIDHTSAEIKGQIYLPKINLILMISCLGLVFGFRSSSALAAAYGIAVTLTMIITTILFYFVARNVWRWPKAATWLVVGLFLTIEGAFFSANMLKFVHGGWFPLAIAAAIFTLMVTWKTGRELLGQRLRASSLPLKDFLREVEQFPPQRVKGTAIFLSGNLAGTPLALLHNIKHNKVLHERNVIMSILTADVPHVDVPDRVEIEQLRPDFYRVTGRFGFMEDPNVPEIINAARSRGLDLEPMESTFFLSRESIIATPKPGMALWRERLFAFMARNAQSATAFFRLPPNRVVELGMQVEI